MLAYSIEKWNKNRSRLEKSLREDPNIKNGDLDYLDLVKKIIDNVLNDDGDSWSFDISSVTEIDDGSYSGTLLFLMPRDTYCPDERDYLMTFVNYGSCTGCDTLKRINHDFEFGENFDRAIKDYMTLCRHIVCNITKPYNSGWRRDERFREVEMRWEDEK